MSIITAISALVSSKIAAGTLAAATLAVGGTTAAAYAGSLPEQLQQTAHEVIGAPAPAAAAAKDAAEAAKKAGADAAEQAKAKATDAVAQATDAAKNAVDSLPVGPDLTGPAAVGLCTAFKAEGGLATNSTAYKSLVVAANGAANIEEFCATVGATGAEANGKASVSTDVAEVNADGTAKADVPSVPALPSEATVPSAPALPSEATDNVSELPTTATRP